MAETDSTSNILNTAKTRDNLETRQSQISFKLISKTQDCSSDLVQSKAWQEMVEIGGRICRVLGLPRSMGQIFGLLYLSPEPISLNKISKMLKISKGTVSTGTRQLEALGAIRKAWIPGERQGYFEVTEDLNKILIVCYNNLIKPKISASEGKISIIKKDFYDNVKSNIIPSQHKESLEKRIKSLEKIHRRIIQSLPLIERIMR